MEWQRVGVIGAGTIGTGVTQALVQAGHEVVLVDTAADILDRARQRIDQQLTYAALFSPAVRNLDPAQVLARIETTTDCEALHDVSFVVENITESWPLKQALYPVIDRICPDACIFAANTSAIPITRLAAETRRRERVIGAHFMNPVPQKETVEVIKGWHTSAETVEATRRFLAGFGKAAIVVNDMPGFVSNRVLMLTVNEAICVVHEKVSTPQDVDDIFVRCFGHKMGPLATADLIGLDTILLTLEVLFDNYRDSKFRPCPLLRQMVDAGYCGRKSGQGFFAYD